MIKAEITVGTRCGDVVIPVEVLGKGPRPDTAWVRALDGLEPFTKTSHGGPYQDSTSVVLIPHLRGIHIEKDPHEDGKIEQLNEEDIETNLRVPEHHFPESEPETLREDPKILVGDRNNLKEDWFLESAYEDRTFIE